jgi:orotidine-5'-phosphate decarboxylase
MRPNLQFRVMLRDRQIATNSLLCVGLDPVVGKMPEVMRGTGAPTSSGVLAWMWQIAVATSPFASMFKLQYACWSAILGGLEAMRELIARLHADYPEIPVMIDCKNGDIGRTQRHYVTAHFGLEGADGMNLNQYMGESTLASLIEPKYPGRALLGLGRTSNPDAWKVQDAMLADGRRVWEMMVELFYGWCQAHGVTANAGVVMGAAHKDPIDPYRISAGHLANARQIVGNDLWLLIPGIGTQGGFIEETIAASYRGPGSIAINVSSEIDFASSGDDFAEASAQKAREFALQMKAV